MSEEQEATPDESSLGLTSEGLHTVAGYSALAGLCPLIPIPFVDDFIVNRVERRMYQKLSAQHDFYLAASDAKYLSESESEFLSGALKSMVLWPVKKIIRKLVYVLTVKSCADVAAAVFHDGWLMARAIDQEYVSKEALARGDRNELHVLREAITFAGEEIDPDVTRQAMRSAFGIGRELFGDVVEAIKSTLSGDAGDAEEKFDAAKEDVAPISERVERELRENWALAPELDAALVRGIERARR